MHLKNGRLAGMVGLLGLACLPAFANAGTVTFGPSEVNLGQGGDGSYRTSVSGGEWAAFGISLENVSLYTSPFDPVDRVGIVGDTSPNPGVISFLSPVSGLSLAVLQAPQAAPALLRAFRPDGSVLLEQTLPSVNDTTLTNVGFAGTVGRVEFFPADFTAVTTVSFTSVPSPGGLGAGSVGLVALCRRRRR
ncbi:MAG: hypothetical protein WC718_11275 [Phycisphaerales bacterium]|jgi:hypothetical protein